jgi:aquaporin Z
MQKLSMEAVGTAVLCFTVSCLPHVAEDMVGLAVGGVLMVLVYAGGPVSGGHYNPAVTLALFVRGLINVNDATLYVAVQCVGAIIGAAAATGPYPFEEAAFPAPAEGIGSFQALAAELCWTWALAYVVMMVATRDEVEGNGYFGLAIGLTLMSAAYCIGPISGCAINPAVGVLAFLHGSSTAWIYVVGPALGGVIAALHLKIVDKGEFYSELFVEAAGTFALCSAVATAAANGTAMAPLAIGGALAAFVYAGGPVSGGMYNPAVSLAVLARNVGSELEPAMEVKKMPLFVLAQLVGALKAACVYAYILNGSDGWLGSLFSSAQIGHPAPAADASFVAAAVSEAFGVMLLVFTVLAVATVPATMENDYFGIAIGFAVVVAASIVGGVSGGAFNPAVACLSLVAGDFSGLVYYFGPVPASGVLLGVGLFKVVYADVFSSAGTKKRK